MLLAFGIFMGLISYDLHKRNLNGLKKHVQAWASINNF